jgi:hypothetical protein
VNFTLSVENFSIPEPDCLNLPFMGTHVGGGRIVPGIYQSVQVPSNEDLILDPGLYCIQGDFRHFGNSLFGEGVTIYMQSGDFNLSGGTIYLTAPISVTVPADGILDMVVFINSGNNSEIFLSGNNQWQIDGVSFGPSSSIALLGSSPLSINVQLLGWNIEFLGGYPITVNFSTEYGYPK